LVIDPPPSKVKVSAVIVPVAVIVAALTVVALTVVMLPVVAASVVNAPVLGVVLPMGVGELSAVASPVASRGALMLSTVYSSTSAAVYTLNLYEDEPSQMLA
jgi:Mrp family chromosome partitioning ATPase